MTTWIWPFSWYYRIKRLEFENAQLKLKVRDITNKLAAESIAHSTTQMGYLGMVENLMLQHAEQLRRFRQYQEDRKAFDVARSLIGKATEVQTRDVSSNPTARQP